jgi:hypothetical protein
MAMTTGTKVVTSAFLLLVFGSSMQSCLRAKWYHTKLKPGMTVPEVFNAVDGWFRCDGHSQRAPTDPYLLFWASPGGDGTYFVHISGQTGDQRSGSKEELIETVQQQMSDGRAWHISFTWSGLPRSSFLVSFDAHGRVEKVSDIAGND